MSVGMVLSKPTAQPKNLGKEKKIDESIKRSYNCIKGVLDMNIIVLGGVIIISLLIISFAIAIIFLIYNILKNRKDR